MKRLVTKLIAAMAMSLLAIGGAQAGGLRASNADGSTIHMYPTVSIDAARKAAQGARSLNAVTYHGGPIMTRVDIYALYWDPTNLQAGGAAVFEPGYVTIMNKMLRNYAGHSVANVNTQYSQTISGVTKFHTGDGSLAGVDIATNPFPARICTDAATPGNCLTDGQLRNQIKARMAARGWTPGPNKIFMVFLPQNMGQCFNSANCAYTDYCAYHSFFSTASGKVIYSSEPYGTAPGGPCQVGGITTPNVPTTVDSAATAARHEISEATTDPLLNAWFDSASGEETSDKCNFNYGSKTFAGGNANYNWGGTNFLLQREYSNHALNCVTDGPTL
jgi:hypothetical protein